jgi:hypothetical protein
MHSKDKIFSLMKCNFKKFTIRKKILIFNFDFCNMPQVKIDEMSCSQPGLINVFPIQIKGLIQITSKYDIFLLICLIIIKILSVNSLTLYYWLLIIIILINLLLHYIVLLLWRVILDGI